MTDDQRDVIETDVLERMLNDLMLEPYYVYDHNNMYQWYRTIIQTALKVPDFKSSLQPKQPAQT